MADANEAWKIIYSKLNGDLELERGGQDVSDELSSRAPAQVLRLSVIFAVLDCSPKVELPHLFGALAVWDFCRQSIEDIFSDPDATVGDKAADKILAWLRDNPNGITRTTIYKNFKNNTTADRITKALDLLKEKKVAFCEVEPSSGKGKKPAERWKLDVVTEREPYKPLLNDFKTPAWQRKYDRAAKRLAVGSQKARKDYKEPKSQVSKF